MRSSSVPVIRPGVRAGVALRFWRRKPKPKPVLTAVDLPAVREEFDAALGLIIGCMHETLNELCPGELHYAIAEKWAERIAMQNVDCEVVQPLKRIDA